MRLSSFEPPANLWDKLALVLHVMPDLERLIVWLAALPPRVGLVKVLPK